MASYQQMLQQMQKIQREYQKAQEVLENSSFDFTANGVVKITMKGDRTLVSIEFLDKDVLKEDPEMVADMIKIAYDGVKKEIDDAIEKIESKFNVPGMPGMF
jgi:DNA-binding protein YbaB